MPTSGARIHSVPRSVAQPFGPAGSRCGGYAERPMTAIAKATKTAAPMPMNRLRGSVRPGVRASEARLATVSRPV